MQEGSIKTGTVLQGKWVVLELIGKGGMGEVYRVHQLNLKRDAAIKILSQDFLQALDRIIQEAAAGFHAFQVALAGYCRGCPFGRGNDRLAPAGQSLESAKTIVRKPDNTAGLGKSLKQTKESLLIRA